MASISKITLFWKYNYVQFNDTDSSVDYFHASSIGQKMTCEYVAAEGADVISISVVNDDDSIPHLRRVKKIAKTGGYDFKDTSYNHKWKTHEGEEKTSRVIKYELTRKAA